MLEINKNFAIGSDELNITLYKRGITEQGKTPGKKYWRVLGYYSTCESALKALVDMEIKGTGLKDFETVVNKIDELHKLIESLAPYPDKKG